VTSTGNTLTLGSTTVKNGTGYAATLVGDTVTDTTTPGNIATGTLVKAYKTSPSIKLKLNTAAVNSATADTLVFCPAVFPGDRLLYNVYSNGFNPDIPVSSDAALNAVSEDGFLCKSSLNTDVDPNSDTGATYLSEIQSIITSQGFYPLAAPGSPFVEDGQNDTTPPFNSTDEPTGIPHPAWNELNGSIYTSGGETGAPYNFPAADTDTDGVGGGTGNNPVGYCLVLTTDGNAAD
jgi:hypothetical protein